MQIRFLLGPSGSGKTFRCLAEARRALLGSPTGLPLVFLAPKQATFQLERQLLADPSLAGYSRLRILSFERLAEFTLQQFGQDPKELLSEEGRCMVLRALLSRERKELKLFRATARLRGFAEQLSTQLRELQRFRFTPDDLLTLAGRCPKAGQLQSKLQDLALLWQAYQDWLQQHQLQDADQLLSLATAELRRTQCETVDASLKTRIGPAAEGTRSPPPLAPERFQVCESLWLDGFAELTPQELEFLTALLSFCQRATLAFNLDREAVVGLSWLSPWSLVGQTLRELQERLPALPGVTLVTEWLERNAPATRFRGNPVLAHLERHWSEAKPFRGKRVETTSLKSDGAPAAEKADSEPQDPCPVANALRMVICPTPEAEATVAAREIRRYIRGGGRYRETAVIVRDLERYFEPVARVFRTFEIPYFLDRREPVGHHPLLQLTRNALRTVAFLWQTEDWFGALKTGLVPATQSEIDRLENEALARGWQGDHWLQPLQFPGSPELLARLEELRQRLLPPFQQLALDVEGEPDGRKLAGALVSFWRRLKVGERLQEWSAPAQGHAQAGVSSSVHATIWQQVQDWAETTALAFAQEKLSLIEWLPIIDAGLSSQTVGVIPPALDQVLVGAVDRSRNPDLKLALLLGMNETVFPARLPEPNLLTTADREHLATLGVVLGQSVRQQLAQERYLGYIACTRARERLVVTWALRDGDDKSLNPSVFVDHLQRLFPDLPLERADRASSWWDCEHVSELMGAALQDSSEGVAFPILQQALPLLPELHLLQHRWRQFQAAAAQDRMSPALAESLYGPILESSVSRLEEYAACPFRFFVTSGLRAEERRLFELDARQQGSFQHEVLARFHQQLQAEKKRWRDLTPAEARERIGQIAQELIPEYAGGLLQADEQRRFTARSLTRSLQNFIGAIVEWMPQYQFDPVKVELAFGIEEKPLPAWEVDLGGGHRLSFRGKIDRVDLCRHPSSGDALCVVIDYKSSSRKLDPVLLAHGIQLQLPAYLNVLRALHDPMPVFGAKRLIPAGVFFVNLRGSHPTAKTRQETLRGMKEAPTAAYQHAGRFEISALPKLDSRSNVQAGDQFKYRLRKDGQIHGSCREALDSARFAQMLEAVESQLRRIGQEIYRGLVKADPYRKGNAVACDRCLYQAICRIDPWSHAYRILTAPGDKEASSGGEATV